MDRTTVTTGDDGVATSVIITGGIGGGKGKAKTVTRYRPTLQIS